MIHFLVRVELERGIGLGLQLSANPCANGMGKDSSSLFILSL